MLLYQESTDAATVVTEACWMCMQRFLRNTHVCWSRFCCCRQISCYCCELHRVIAGAVLADVGLLWHNCRTFNAEGSDISAMADEAEAHFVQLWAKKELPFESADVSGGVAEPPKHALLQTPTGASHGEIHPARTLNIKLSSQASLMFSGLVRILELQPSPVNRTGCGMTSPKRVHAVTVQGQDCSRCLCRR